MFPSTWSLGRGLGLLGSSRRGKKKCRKGQMRRGRSLQIEPLEQRQLLSVSPLSDEWLVNTYTANTQKLAESGSALAARPDGGCVATWTSNGQDGSGMGIYAQQFTAAGAALGSEFRVNTTTAGDQQRSSVAVGDSGNSVIVWESYGQDGDHAGVYGQRYAADGSALGGEFQVNQTTLGYQQNPSAAFLTNGDFVVVWGGKGQGDVSGIFGRRYDASGTALSSEFLINTQTAYEQQLPALAALPDSSFLVAWQSHGDQDGDASGIYSQRFESTGARVGGETLVNTTTASFQQYAAIGVAADGQFTIAWQSNLQDGSGYGIFAQRYSAAGGRIGGELAVNTFTDKDQLYPSVAYNDHGGFAIAYNGKGTGDNAGVFVREFDAAGQALGNESLVNTTTDSAQQYPTVVAAGSGYALAWSGRGAGDTDGVFLRRLGSGPTTSGIAAVNVQEDAPDTVIDLTAAFADAENGDNRLAFQVTGNTNSGLFSGLGIGNGQLTLSYAPNAFGAATLTLRATDPGGLYAETTFDVDVASVNDAPVIGRLLDAPDPAINGAGLRLEAADVADVDGTVQSVAFYRDANRDGVLDAATDQLLGTDGNGADGWGVSVSTAGFGSGAQRYFAVATDDQDATSTLATTTGTLGLMAVLDNSDPGYTETGAGWTNDSGSAGLYGNARVCSAGVGDNRAQWVFTGLAPGSYEVQLAWTAGTDRASNAPYNISNGAGTLGTASVNQRVAPNGVFDGTTWWQSAGTFQTATGTLAIKLTDAANGVVSADAVRLVSVAPMVLYWDPDGNAANNVPGSGAGLGGSGTWTAGGGNCWYNPVTGQNGGWVNGARAVLSGASGTVTLSGEVSVDRIIVTGGNFTLQSGTLNLPAYVGTTVEVAGGTATIAATLAGPGGLLKSGAGTLILTGTNTFAGGTTIDGGTLQIGNGGTTGSIVGSVVNNANLKFNRSDAVTFAGAIGGTGSLTKLGAGTLTLSGTNSYAGATTVSAGILKAGSMQAFGTNSAVTLANASGAALDIAGFDNAIGSLVGGGTAGGNVALGAAVLTVGGNSTSPGAYAGVISGAGGAILKIGTGTLSLSGANTYTGATTINAGTLQFNSAGAIGGSGRTVTVADGATVAAGYAIDNTFLNRLAENGNAFNINMAVASSNALDFSGSTGANLPNAVLCGAGGLTYSGALTPGGNTYRLGNLDTTNAFSNTTRFIVSSPLSGAGNSLVISGSNFVELTGSLSYKGTTTVNPGAALRIDASLDTIGGGPGVRDILVGNGASFLRTGGAVNNAFLKRLVETTNTFTIYFGNANCANNLDFSGTAGGAYLPNVYLAAYASNNQSFSYTGALTPAENTYRLGGPRGSGSFTILPNANQLTGARALVVGGRVQIGAANNFSGDTLINNACTLTISGSGSLGSGNYCGAITNNGTLLYSSSANQTLSGPIGGPGALTKDTSAISTLTLAGANTYAGATTVTAGTLSLSGSGTLGNGANNLTVNGGALNLGATTDRTVGAVSITKAAASGDTIGNGSLTGASYAASNATGNAIVSAGLLANGAAGLTKSGAGILTLSGTNTYAGKTTVSAGVLRADDGTGLPTGSLLVFSGSALVEAKGTIARTIVASDIAGNNVRWSVNNNSMGFAAYGGPLTINLNNGGTIDYEPAAGMNNNKLVLGSSTANNVVTLVNGVSLKGNNRTIVVNDNPDSTADYAVVSGNISNGDASNRGLTKEGAGTLILSGNNSFTGDTKIVGGVLALGSAAALGGSTLDWNNYGGGLDLGNFSAITLGGLKGAQDLALANDSAQPLALTVGGNNVSTTYAGALSGGGSLTKTGTGILTLSGANTYAGETAVAGGVLKLDADNALPTTAVVRIGDQNFASGILDLGGHNLTLAGLYTGAEGPSHGAFWDAVVNASETAATLTLNNSADYLYAGHFAGNLSLAKYGAGRFTVGGVSTNYGTVVAYDGTLEVTGCFVADVTAVPGFGDPQLLGKVDPVYFTVIAGAAHGEAGLQIDDYHFDSDPADDDDFAPGVDHPQGLWPTDENGNWVVDGNGKRLNRVVVEATDWRAAVYKAVRGTITVPRTGKTLTFPQWDGVNDPSSSDPAELIYDTPAFLVGTVAALEDAVTRLHNADAFDLDNSQSFPSLRSDTKLIVMEDLTDMPLKFPYQYLHNDQDYDDAYWVVTVYRIPDLVPPGGGCDCGCGCGQSDTTTAPNISPTNGACSVSAPGGLRYDSRTTENNFGTGNGWYSQATPQVMKTGDGVAVVFSASRATWFKLEAGTYEPQYGSKERLTDADGFYTLTEPDGTRYEFYDFVQTEKPGGSFYRSVAPGGATTVVVSWNDDNKPLEVDYKLSPEATIAYQKTTYDYWEANDSNAGQVHYVTLYGTNSSVPVSRVAYSYYVTGTSETNGLTGDLKTAILQQYDAANSSWSAGDTTYMRYYTESYQAGTNPGFEHGLKRVLLPEAYAKLAAKMEEWYPNAGKTPLDASEDPNHIDYIGNFTCYYFTYDANQRVSEEVVFGGTREYTLDATTESTNPDDYNNWKRKTVETQPDGVTTNTVYVNYLGQELLSDLWNGKSGGDAQHWITYNRYGTTDDGIAGNDGLLILSAEPSAVTNYTKIIGQYWEGVDWNGTVTFTADGLVYETVYYPAEPATPADETTAGGVEGYVAYQLSRLSDSNPDQVFDTVASVTRANLTAHYATVTAKYEYYARWTGESETPAAALAAGEQIIYPLASQTTYNNEESAAMVGRWALDEQSGATAADSSAYGNTGTLLGGAEFSDGALTLEPNGAAQVRVDEGSALDIDGADLTISAWVYADQVAGWQYIAAKRNGPDSNQTATQYGLYVNPDGTVYFCTRGSDFDNPDAYSQTGVLTAGLWHQVVAVYQDRDTYGDVTIYLDGQDVTNPYDDTCAPITHAASDLYIGARGNDPNYPHTTSLLYGWNGQLDDVRVYDRALSADEVSRQYTGAATTSYAYAWYTTTGHELQAKEVRTTLPAVWSEQNGSGTAAATFAYYSSAGNLEWSADERGRFTHYEYNEVTGLLEKTVEDVDLDGGHVLPTSFELSGWPSSLPGDGLHLVTDYSYDPSGRLVQTLGPIHTVDLSGTATWVRTASWTVYKDAVHETWSAQGYATYDNSTATTPTGYTLVNPVSITKTDRDGRVTDQIQAVAATTDLDDEDPLAVIADEPFERSDFTAWTANTYRNTRLAFTAVYFNIPTGTTRNSDGFYGVEGTDYNKTTIGYEDYDHPGVLKGRQNMVTTPDGTITRNVLDARGNVRETWVGTDDTGFTDADPGNHGEDGNNMVEVSEYVYDGGLQGGDGLLTTSIAYVDEPTAGEPVSRQTQYGYTWRDQLQWTYSTDGTYTWDSGNEEWDLSADPTSTYAFYDYDNLGRTTMVRQYHDVGGGGVDTTYGGPDATNDDVLIGVSEAAYDDLGRVYESTQYAVNPTSGTVTGSLTSYAWYDAAGNVFKSQPAGSQAFTKTAYDGLGRVTKVYVGFDLDEDSYYDSINLYDGIVDANGNVQVDGDTIFEQTEYTYNEAGETIFVTARQRNHNASDEDYGALDGTNSRTSYSAAWYDGIGRQIATANWGTNDGVTMDAGDRPDAAPTESDADVLVTRTAYDYTDFDTDGDLDYIVQSTDAAGRVDWSIYDAAGRVVRTIQNYDDGDPTTGVSGKPFAADQDVTVLTTYTADGQVATYTAVNPTTDDQTTTYVYGSDRGFSNALIHRNDLLRAVIYPESDDTTSLDDGVDEVYDRVEYCYNRLGEQTQVKDQNATVHDYVFDGLGRLTEDIVTDYDDGLIDYSVLRIDRAYEVRGMIDKITSYSSVGGGSGNVVNEVFRQYNDWGLLAAEYQDHDSAVSNLPSGPHVEYLYGDASNPTRLTGMVYPNERELTYNYSSAGGCPDYALGRVTSISDDDENETVLAEYTYLGLGQVLGVRYPEPEIAYDLDHQASGQYDYLDQFGRVTGAVWTHGVDDLVSLGYGYDFAGNRLWREDAAADAASVDLDERYWYDGVNQLVDMQRGDLDFIANPDDPTIATLSKNFAQQWDLDATGNWGTFQEDADGDGDLDLDQDRTHNAANELTSADTWASPDYDAAGNMTSVPDPYDLDSALTCTYDAWNRLVKVERGETLVAEYRYDGLNRRIEKITPGGTRHFYLSGQNQVLEERLDASSNAERQNVWGLRYVDDLVLRDRDTDANGSLDERLYALQDANWNVVAVVGCPTVTWQVLERHTYTAYGKCEIRLPDFSLDGDQVSNYAWTSLYTTREFDPETGLYYYRARYYDADMGRFINRDPMYSTPNLYAYCGNNPTIYVDPVGLSEDRTPVHILAAAPEGGYGSGSTIVATINLGQMIKEVQAKIDADSCLGTLEIWGHANPWEQMLGDLHGSKSKRPAAAAAYSGSRVGESTMIDSSNAKDVGATLAKLPWCCSCTIILGGCNTGNLKGALTWPQVLANATGCTVRATGGYAPGTVQGGDKEIKQWYYLENAPHPGLYERFGNWWAGVPGSDYSTIQETTETHASENGKWYEFTPNPTAAGALQPGQPGDRKKCCKAK